MRDEFLELKKKLEEAQSEEDVLAALNSFPRQLTDEESAIIAGGFYPGGNYAPE